MYTLCRTLSQVKKGGWPIHPTVQSACVCTPSQWGVGGGGGGGGEMDAKSSGGGGYGGSMGFGGGGGGLLDWLPRLV